MLLYQHQRNVLTKPKKLFLKDLPQQLQRHLQRKIKLFKLKRKRRKMVTILSNLSF